MELSNIPNTGFFNRIASLINENFDKIRQRFLEVGDASASANAAAASAAQAAQSLATIQNEIASLDPSQSTEAAIAALDAKIAVNKANIETLDDRVDSIGGVKTTNVYTLPASWRAETFGIEDGDRVKITFNNASVQTVGGLYLYINYASSPAVTKYVRLGSSAIIDIGEGYQRIMFWAVASSSSSTQIACDVSLTVQIYGEMTVLEEEIAAEAEQIENLQDRIESSSTDYSLTFTSSAISNPINVSAGDIIDITITSFVSETANCIFLQINRTGGASQYYQIRPNEKRRFTLPDDYNGMYMQARVYGQSTSTGYPAQVGMTVDKIGLETRLGDIESVFPNIVDTVDKLDGKVVGVTSNVTIASSTSPVDIFRGGSLMDITVDDISNDEAGGVSFYLSFSDGTHTGYYKRRGETLHINVPTTIRSATVTAVASSSSSTALSGTIDLTIVEIGLTERVSKIESYNVEGLSASVNGSETTRTYSFVSTGSDYTFGITDGQIVDFTASNFSEPAVAFLYYFITYENGWDSGYLYSGITKRVYFRDGLVNIRFMPRSGSHVGYDCTADIDVKIIGLSERVQMLERRITSLPTSAYLTNAMLEDKSIPFPTALDDEDYTEYEVTNEEQLESAISAHSENGNVSVILKNNVTLSKAINITGSGRFRIEGCGHTITKASVVYQNGSVFSGNVNPRFVFVTDNLDVIRLSETKKYTVTGGVTNSDGSQISDGRLAGNYRVPVPPEVILLNLDSDNTYMNITTGFVSIFVKVMNVAEGYLYFSKNASTYSINYDYYNYQKYASIYFVNVKGFNGVTIKDGVIKFPKQYTEVRQSLRDLQTNYPNIIRAHSSGIVELVDLEIVGGIDYSESYDSMIYATDSIISIDKCKIRGGSTVAIRIACSASSSTPPTTYSSQLHVRDSEFSDIGGYCLMGDQNTIVTCTESRFSDVGFYRTSSACVYAVGKFYIARNNFINYGYSAVQVGWNGNYIGNHTGAVEYNYCKFEPEYMAEAENLVPMDGGAIYSGANSNGIYIRFNRVVNYTGRHINRGIYMDDGCYDFYVIGNVVENVPKSYAISAILGSGRTGAPNGYNINKHVLHNVFEGTICVEGDTEKEDNGCKVGYNIRVSGFDSKGDSIKNIPYMEEIIELKGLSLVDGTVHTPLDLSKWGII